MTQAIMFPNGDDLPLFTGQPVSSEAARFTPRVHYRQLRLEDTHMQYEQLENVDQIEVTFTDDTTTTLFVTWDDDLADAVVEMCERMGWDTSEVRHWKIVTH
jgi:hypothetical protein